MLLFHGGKLTGTMGFWPFTHFGSRQAALDRIAQNYQDCLPGEPASNILYECEVELGSNVIDLPDWDIALPAGLIYGLHEYGVLDVTQSERNRLLDSVIPLQRDKPLDARRMIAGMIAHLDITAIRYPNQHEGVRDTPSYCVIAPSQARILSAIRIPRHPSTGIHLDS